MPTFIKGGIWSKRKNIPKISNGELNLDEFFKSQASYKAYAALVSQTGTNPPTSTILSNDTTLTFTWSYVNVGIFDLNISSDIDLNKVLVLSPIQFYNGPGATVLLVFEQNSSTTTKLRFRCSQLSGSSFNGLLLNQSLEIRVYN